MRGPPGTLGDAVRPIDEPVEAPAAGISGDEGLGDDWHGRNDVSVPTF